jgi:PAS domain S-box-containing protein
MTKPLRLLVVEDSEDDTLLLMRELKRIGYSPTYKRIETADAMQQALAHQQWDIIFTDYTMPHFNALSALNLLKDSGYDIPFIIVSGTIGEERAVAAMKAGAHDYLQKGHLARLNPIIERELRDADVRRERRRAEETIRERERYFRALIENTYDIIITLDAEQQITYASPAIVRVMGYQNDHYENNKLSGFLHSEDIPDYVSAFAQLLQMPGKSVATQFRMAHKNGSWLWFEAGITNLLNEPGIQAIVANLRDVSERNQLQAQLLQSQKMEAVGQLTAGIAHDFNNLLTVINSYAELLQLRLPPDESLQKMALRIYESGERAATLVRRLLAFSQKQIINPETLNLNDIVKKMDKLLREIIGEHIQMSLNLTPNLWFIKADRSQIEQTIVNLAVNARDAMTAGGSLTIETENVLLVSEFTASHLGLNPGPHLLLTLSDTGTGMTDDVKAHLFEPFFTTKEEGKGSGLGLATVYGIVKQSNGSIWIESEVDQGTIIKIYFPRADGAEAAQPAPKTALKPGPATETILLVEDNDAVREIVSEILQDLGYTVLIARNGQHALKLVSSYSEPIDLLLSDIVMPGISGRTLAETLQQTHPNLKVLLMTGYSEETIADFGVVTPKIDLLQKPYMPQDLIRKVQEILD